MKPHSNGHQTDLGPKPDAKLNVSSGFLSFSANVNVITHFSWGKDNETGFGKCIMQILICKVTLVQEDTMCIDCSDKSGSDSLG